MSTAARKQRKRARRAGIVSQSFNGGPAIPTRFQHPKKLGTPVTERAAFQGRPIHSSGRQMPSRFGVTSRIKARLLAYVTPANPLQTGELSVTEAQPGLDPKPFRIGRKRYTLEEAHAIGQGDISDIDRDDLVWSPRKGYQADRARYDG